MRYHDGILSVAKYRFSLKILTLAILSVDGPRILKYLSSSNLVNDEWGRSNWLASNCPLHQAPADGPANINEKTKRKRAHEASRSTYNFFVGQRHRLVQMHCFLFVLKKVFFKKILFSGIRCVSLTKKMYLFAH